MSLKSITPADVYERIRAGRPVDLVDVRLPAEYERVHAVGARLVPLDVLSKERVLAGRLAGEEEPVYVICRSGGRSRTACARLTEQGLTNVVNVEGGTTAWERAGLPVERSERAGPGRILRVGGLLAVAASLILSATVSPAFGFAAAGIWLVMVLTGNGPCCSSDACSIVRKG
jgi:rhodanese-related sulfurtransferase